MSTLPLQQAAFQACACRSSRSSPCCMPLTSSSSAAFGGSLSRVDISRSATRSRPSRRSGMAICEVALKVEGTQSSSKAIAGSKIRVKGPLKVYHVPKVAELELDGMEGTVKEVLTTWKGKPISANLPFKVQFETSIGDKPVKFVAHLRENELELIE